MELEPLEVDARSSGDDARVKAPSPRWTRPPDARAPAENATPRVADIASRVVLRWARADCPRREAALEAGPRGDATWPRPLRRGARGRASRRRGRARWTAARCRASAYLPTKDTEPSIGATTVVVVSSQTSQRALRGSGEPAMSEADGALISHLDDLQARLSRVAALSAPVDVAVGSVRSSPARALKKRAAHSPRPTSLVSPLASPALEGRAAYYQTRDVVPGRAKRRYEIPSRHEPGGSDTKRGSPSLHATHHHETRLGRMTGRHFFSSPPRSPAARVAAESSDQQLDEPRERESGKSRPSPPRSLRQFSSGLTGTVTERPSFRDDDAAFEKNAAATVAELDATRARRSPPSLVFARRARRRCSRRAPANGGRGGGRARRASRRDRGGG